MTLPDPADLAAVTAELREDNDRAMGMSLRDYFAASALPNLVGKGYQMAAEQAYKYADAMLKARA